MSVKVMSWVFEHSRASAGDLLVLLILADHADDETWSCWPGIARLAALARMSERGVQYCLRNLEALEELKVTPPGEHKTNTYRICLEQYETLPFVSGRLPAEDGGVQSLHPVKPSSPRGEAQFTGGVKPSSPEPSLNHHEPPFSEGIGNILLWIDQQCTKLTGKGFHATSPRAKRALQEQDSPGLRSAISQILEEAPAGRNVASLITGLVSNGRRVPRAEIERRAAYRDSYQPRQQYDRPKPPSRMELALQHLANMKPLPSNLKPKRPR